MLAQASLPDHNIFYAAPKETVRLPKTYFESSNRKQKSVYVGYQGNAVRGRVLPSWLRTKMTALTSIDAVRRKILSLQQAADDAEDRAELMQMEADMERQGRKGVKLEPSAASQKRTPTRS